MGSAAAGLLHLIVGPVVVLVVCGLLPALGEKVFTNQWAVHIPGGLEEADRVASKYGFINHGHVSHLSFTKTRFFSSRVELF